MEEDDIKKMLIMDHEMLMVLKHFELAKLDYAKNIKIYTSIPQANVQIYIERLYSMDLIEKYSGSSVKRTEAKLKKTNEVHKHHTYYHIANKGHYILRDMTEREYIKYVDVPGLRLILLKRERKENPERCQKLYEMGLMDKNYEPTEMGMKVVDLAKRRQVKIL